MSLLISNPSYATWSLAINTNNIASISCNVSPKSSSSVDLKHSGIKSQIKSSTTDHKPYHPHRMFESYVVEKSVSVNRILNDAIVVKEPAKCLGKSIEYSLLLAPGPCAKRVRAALCIAACELVGGEECTAIPTACAIEIFHAGSTILADLPSICSNSLRWGKAANHEVFGEDMAILAGHSLLSDAFHHLATHSKLVLPPQRIVRAIGELAKYMGAKGLVCDDQMVNSNVKGRESRSEVVGDQFNVHFHKPDAILELSLVLGAIVGGAAEDDDGDQRIDSLKDFAKCIGPLFHMVELTSLGYDDDNVKSFIRKTMLNNSLSVEKLCMDAKNHLNEAAFHPNKAAPLIALADTIIAYSNDPSM